MKSNNKGMWIVLGLFVLLIAGLIVNVIFGN